MKFSELNSAMEYNLSARQIGVLLLIDLFDKMPGRVIAKRLNIPRPAVTRAFDGLCLRGLIKRQRGEDDGRDVYGVLTAKGKTLVEKLK